jgi:methylated-DNA-[protein]-cysteine S-methyltransferase
MPAIEPAKSTGYYVFDTEIGACGIAWSGIGLTRLQLPEVDRQATERRLRSGRDRPAPAAPPPHVAFAIAALERYFAGERLDFTALVIDLEAVALFYRRVYEAARGVGWGETTTYGELARVAGSPGAARGVGQALSRNPVPVIVPCHRILASGNKVGGFSAFGGTASKERLLALEGVRIGRAEDRRQLVLSERW